MIRGISPVPGFIKTPNIRIMKKVKRFSILISNLCLLVFLSSCFSPSPILRLNPLEEDTKWNYGREVVHQSKGDFEISIAYEGFDKENIIFDVAIANYSEEEVLISPNQIFMTDNNDEWLGNAINPEQAIFELDTKISRNEANAKNAGVAAGVLLVGLVVADAIIESNDDNDDSDWCDDDGDFYFFSGGGNSAPPLPPIIEQRSFLTDYTLRKTHVESNRVVSGKVLFPRQDDQIFLNINIPIRKTNFSAKFRQIVYKPH